MIMGLPQKQISLQNHLEGENVQPERHEFYRGEVFTISCGRRSHGRVTANLARHPGNQLAGKKFQVFSDP